MLGLLGNAFCRLHKCGKGLSCHMVCLATMKGAREERLEGRGGGRGGREGGGGGNYAENHRFR